MYTFYADDRDSQKSIRVRELFTPTMNQEVDLVSSTLDYLASQIVFLGAFSLW